MIAYESVNIPLCPIVEKYARFRCDLISAGLVFEVEDDFKTLLITIIDIDA